MDRYYYDVEFTGRKLGAIGKTYKIKEKVYCDDAMSDNDIRKTLHDIYEHVSLVYVSQMKPSEIKIDKVSAGPWQAVKKYTAGQFGYDLRVMSQEKYPVCEVNLLNNANAALIAAAPELLNALKNLWSAVENGTVEKDFYNLREEIRDAITKAETY